MPPKRSHTLASIDRGVSAAPTLDQRASDRTRALLMMRLRDIRRAKGLTQVQAARWFGVSQPRISHLAQNRTERFTTDTLINMLDHAGIRLSLAFEPRLGVGDSPLSGQVARSPESKSDHC